MKNIFKSNIYYIICLLLVFACSNDDTNELFNESPAARIDSRNQELFNLLTKGSEAYKVLYFTNDDTFGAFNFFMDFNEDYTVEMTSDFDTNQDVTVGNFDIRFGTTTELIFTTRNHIHKVVDSRTPGLIGTGYGGNSTFLYIKNENGNIHFKELRGDADLVFIPISRADFSQVKETYQMRIDFAQAGPNTPVFKNLEITVNGEVQRYDLNFNNFLLYASPSIETADGIKGFDFGIGFTTTGLKVSPPIEVNGVVFEDFEFNPSEGNFVSVVGSDMAVIGPSSEPGFIGNDIEDLDDIINIFEFNPARGENPLTSVGMKELVETINSSPMFKSFNFTFSRVIYFFDGITNGDTVTVQFRFRQNGGGEFSANYDFTGEVKDKLLHLTYIGPDGGNATFVENSFQPFIDFLTSEKGMLLVNEGSFSTSSQNFSNLSVSLTSLSMPNLRHYGIVYN